MKRKLIRQGGGGLTFYIPKQWASGRSLKQGDEINVEEIEDKLIISTDKIEKKSEVDITIGSQSAEYIRNYLNQIYRLGYDTINIHCTDKKNVLLCQKLVQMFLMGFEITDSKEEYCRAESVSEPDFQKKQAILRRIFILIMDSYTTLQKDRKLSGSEEIYRNTRKVTQYDNFFRRALVKQNIPFNKQFFEWEMCSILLLIQHSFYHIYATKTKLPKAKSLSDNFNEIYQAYYRKDLEKLDLAQREANAQAEKGKSHYYCELARLQYLLCTPMIAILQFENKESQHLPVQPDLQKQLFE